MDVGQLLWVDRRDAVGKFRMMLRDYIDEGNFIICPQAELRVSLRVLRGVPALFSVFRDT